MTITDRRGVVVSATDPPVIGDPNPGLAIKVPVRVATTGTNIVLSGLQTIDGVALNAADRVLVKDQTDPTTNGIYSASTGNWTRTNDMAGNGQIANGILVYVLSGTLNGSYKGYSLQGTDPIVIGQSAINFVALAFPLSAIEFVIDGGGAGVTTGYKGAVEIPFNARVVRMSLVADVAGSIVLDIRQAPFSALPPAPATSIVGTDPPTLASQQTAQDTTLATWTTALVAGDWLAFYVTSTSGIGRVTCSLAISRS